MGKLCEWNNLNSKHSGERYITSGLPRSKVVLAGTKRGPLYAGMAAGRRFS